MILYVRIYANWNPEEKLFKLKMNENIKFPSDCSTKMFLQGKLYLRLLYYKTRATNASYPLSNSVTPCYGKLLSNSATEL